MSVYVDPITDYPTAMVKGQAARWGTRWSHMTADTEEELHAMAAKLGLKRSYFQRRPGSNRGFDHYDITPPKRAAAIRMGAIEETHREFIERVRGRIDK